MKAWILSLLLHLSPPERAAQAAQLPGWAEDAVMRRARYASIADDVAAVAGEGEALFAGPRARERSAALLVAVAFMESGFARDVDLGPCYRPRISSPRCDGGHAASMWQIRLGAGRTREGWSQADLFADRRKAVRVALRLIRSSARACARLGTDAALDAYVSGRCGAGRAAGRARLALARRLLARLPPP